MDDPALPPGDYRSVLGDLARVNQWTFAARPTLSFLKRASHGLTGFRLLDVGFGDGDMLRTIAHWAQRQRLDVALVGVDLNEKSLTAARDATSSDLPIQYRTGDYRDLGSFDFVISSLVAHHMSDAQLRDFLIYMEGKARRGWLINDLHRHPLSYLGFPVLARLLRVHRIVREDGQLSIARSFRSPEWESILADAGILSGTARIRRYFPFRLCVERLR
jgi:2-polyprenyl-3-methyl-5-hydroxy-6-metoxy-1,4-benzoquinol methylase